MSSELVEADYQKAPLVSSELPPKRKRQRRRIALVVLLAFGLFALWNLAFPKKALVVMSVQKVEQVGTRYRLHFRVTNPGDRLVTVYARDERPWIAMRNSADRRYLRSQELLGEIINARQYHMYRGWLEMPPGEVVDVVYQIHEFDGDQPITAELQWVAGEWPRETWRAGAAYQLRRMFGDRDWLQGFSRRAENPSHTLKISLLPQQLVEDVRESPLKAHVQELLEKPPPDGDTRFEGTRSYKLLQAYAAGELRWMSEAQVEGAHQDAMRIDQLLHEPHSMEVFFYKPTFETAVYRVINEVSLGPKSGSLQSNPDLVQYSWAHAFRD